MKSQYICQLIVIKALWPRSGGALLTQPSIPHSMFPHLVKPSVFQGFTLDCNSGLKSYFYCNVFFFSIFLRCMVYGFCARPQLPQLAGWSETTLMKCLLIHLTQYVLFFVSSTNASDIICANFCKLVARVEDFLINHKSFSVIRPKNC